MSGEHSDHYYLECNDNKHYITGALCSCLTETDFEINTDATHNALLLYSRNNIPALPLIDSKMADIALLLNRHRRKGAVNAALV